MRPAALAPALLGLALLWGCGWKRDLAAGQVAADQGHWLEAVARYEAAAEARPDDNALKARLAEAREHAVAQLVEQAQAALAGGEPYEALNLLDQADVVSPRQLPVALAREDVVGVIAAQVRALLAGAADDPVGAAFEAWVSFAERFPVHPETARLRDDLEAALGAEVQHALERGDFAVALARLDGFSDKLPLDRARQAVTQAWAEDLTSQAQTAARKRQPATAWVAMALAAGLDPQRAAQRDVYAQAFAEASGPVIGPRLAAADRQALARIESRLLAAYGQGTTRWTPGARRTVLGGKLALGEPRWEQSAKATVAVHERPGPERDHENPAYLEAQAALDEARAGVTAAEQRETRAVASRAAEQRSLDGMRQGLAAVEQALEGVRQRVAAAQAAATEAQAGLDEAVGAHESVTQLETQRAELEAAVAPAQASLDASLAALQAATESGGDVGAANAAVTEARRALEDARAAVEAAPRPTNLARELSRHVGTRASQLAEKERILEAARAELADQEAPVRDQLDAVASIEARIVELDAEIEAAREAQAEAARDVERAEASLASIPPTIFGPTIERHEVSVQAHLRSCAVELAIELLPEGLPPVRETLSARAETRDEERPAVPELDLAADPLVFPVSDAELQAQVELELTRQLRDRIDAQVAALAARLLAEAEAATDLELRLRLLLQAWMLGPGPGADPYAEPGAAAPSSPTQALTAAMQARWSLGETSWLTTPVK